MERTMKNVLVSAAVALMTLTLPGCFSPQAYSFTADSVSGINAPDRLAAGWTYSIENSIKDAKRTSFKPTSHPCSLHTYSLDGSSSLESAIRKAMQDFLEAGAETKSASNVARHISFRLEGFQPRFSCSIGATEGHCTGTAEIALGITVVKDGARRAFSVSSERTADASGGTMCANALAAPAEATRKAAKDVVERAMERIVTFAK